MNLILVRELSRFLNFVSAENLSFSRGDSGFFEISTVKEEISLQFETLNSDKLMIVSLSYSNFLSTASNSFMKMFWKKVKLCVVSLPVGLTGLLGVSGTSNDMPEIS